VLSFFFLLTFPTKTLPYDSSQIQLSPKEKEDSEKSPYYALHIC